MCRVSYLCRILLSNTSVHFHFYSTLATAPVSSSPVCAPLAGDGARCGGDTQPSYTCFHCPATHCLDQEHHTWVISLALPVSIRRNYGQKLTLSPGGVSRYPQHVCLTALNNIHRVHAELRRHISEHFTEPGDHNWRQIS